MISDHAIARVQADTGMGRIQAINHLRGAEAMRKHAEQRKREQFRAALQAWMSMQKEQSCR